MKSTSEPPVESKEVSTMEAAWFTKTQIAARYQISTRSVTNLMRHRILPFVKIGRLLRFNPTDCDVAFARFQRSSKI
jgi:hypothetical protein